MSPPPNQQQEPVPSQPVPSQPVPAPAPQPPVSIPPAQPGPAIPSLPAYDPQRTAPPGSRPATQPPAALPAPAPSPSPVVQTPQAPAPAPYSALAPYQPYGVPDEYKVKDHDGSTYIPVDSWVYEEMTRLYSLGFADTMFLGMRPWTRKSVEHMLEASEDDIRDSNSDEAKEILAVLDREFAAEDTGGVRKRGTIFGTESVYTRVMGITGNTLRDSYHLGTTLNNDYGRPYQPGFNSLIGVSTVAESGRFSFYVRGEYQHAPSAAGYSPALSALLSNVDTIPYSGFNQTQATIPAGPIGASNPFRLQEATLSFHILGHEISGGKSDAWLGPGKGGALAWSNNAEDIYSFRINRVEPLHIPLVSRVIGPIRYDFFYGSLKGHTDPNSPYVHSEQFSFRPTRDLEFAFQRTIIFGGKGHEPVTFHKFLKGFFDINDTTFAEKFSANDPGARFSAFDMSWRLPFIRRAVLFYVDSITHDDVTPISAPRRAAFRTGVDWSHLPFAPRLELRAEGVLTDQSVSRSIQGQFNYFEGVQVQGYTNKGFILGDWMGREAKGGQVWLTYHLSGNEWIQLEYLNKKTAKDFVPLGTTQNSFKATVEKRFLHDQVELNGWFQYERWKAPVYLPGQQSNTTTAVQVTYWPRLKTLGVH